MQDFATGKAVLSSALHQLTCFISKSRKAVRIMKITGILLLAACLQVSANGLTQTVTISVKDAPLLTVLKEIKKQTGYTFFADRKELQKAKNVSITAIDLPLLQLLDLCFKDQPLTYEISEKVINVYPKNEKKSTETTTTEIQQTALDGAVDITGRVTNEQGEPLAGANVVVKRTGMGTITNANGQFALKGLTNDDVLRISYVGYTPLIIPVKGKTNFTLVMNIASNKLDEAVVQAYGKTTDRLRTGNIARITSEDIGKQPVMNVLNVLQGQTPGTVVTHASGYASGPIKVEIRGRNTINPAFTSDPLYIIDGVPLTILDILNNEDYESGSQGIIRSGIRGPANGQSPLFSLNPADIESIEVLKDADATAIYGSRASNGVILITTKKGKAGKTNFDVNIYQGVSKITTFYKVLSTQQYIAMRKEALTNDLIPIDINSAPDLFVWDTTRYTNWQKYLYRGTGKITEVQGTLTGGNAQTSFRIGTGYQYQRDILAVSGANKRTSFSLNLNHKSLNQRFGVSLSAQYSNTSSDLISSPGASLLAPNAPDVYDSKGALNYRGWYPLDYSYPFASFLQPYNSKTNFLNSQLNLNYELAKGLTFKTSFGYNNTQNNQKYLITIASQDPQYYPVGTATFGYSFIRNLIAEPQLEFNTFFGRNKIEVLVGTSLQSNETSSLQAAGSGYKNDVLMSSINSAPTKFTTINNGEYKYSALFGRVSYNLKNKYLLNINFRRDGSSRFGPGRQYGNFGAIGGAWIFSEEEWIKSHLHFLSFGKIRSSYGITGGDQISDYGFLSQWAFQNNILYNGIVPLVATKHTDSLLQWQVNKKLELGVSLGFLNNRINLDVSWYRHRCNNQLVLFPTPAFTGFGDVISNSPANVQNTGYEISVNSKIFDSKNFKWDLKFNISRNRNKLISYPNFSESPYASRFTLGKSINIVKLLHSTGVNPQTGLYQFQDKNKDGNITIDYSGKTEDDRYDLDRSPKFDGGFNNSFTYKNLELGIFFYFKKQIGQNAFANLDGAGGISNQPEEVYLNHWKKPGDVAQYAKFTTMPYDASFQNFFYNSDGRLTDASFIRLQNVYLSYLLSDLLKKKTVFKTCKVYLAGQNLLLITKYKGSDPEIQAFGALPIPKTFTLGLSCNF